MQTERIILGGLAVAVGYLLYSDKLHRGVNDLSIKVATRHNDEIEVLGREIRRLRDVSRGHTQAVDVITETMGLMKMLIDVRSMIAEVGAR